MRYITHKVDFCVVGGGLAGMAAAISAARHGVKVALMQDRPVLGGNASSEIRMWVCGAHGKNNRETGIIEEIILENRYRNAMRNYSVWDSVLWEKAHNEPNITLLLNCSCNQVEMDGSRIVSVQGWQGTAETWHTVEADLFADCSGDSILAPLTGAEFRVGREACSEFDEDIEPEQADKRTMGLSCLIQAREMDTPQPFVAPEWANVYETEDDLPFRSHELPVSNFWWIELGGEMDSIHDTEAIRDALLKVAYGVWDHIKNRGNHGADNWALEWVGMLPGKRESRRYVGDHTVTQNEVRARGQFEDLVAYGGWTMDDHHPAGFNHKGEPTIFHPAPSPFGIPYRSLYSKNIDNLFFAGRNISVTHAAMSATRVMATCALVGQAVGTAASLAIENGLSPRAVYTDMLSELKQRLMDDDCYLPWNKRSIPDVMLTANLSASEGDPEPVRNGYDRPAIDGDSGNGWTCAVGGWLQAMWDQPQRITGMRFTFDSDLDRPEKNQPANYPKNQQPVGVPQTLVKHCTIQALNEKGEWIGVDQITNNYQRLLKVPLSLETTAIRVLFDETWGSEAVHLFAWEVTN